MTVKVQQNGTIFLSRHCYKFNVKIKMFNNIETLTTAEILS